jgi:tetratricopeptide (TPR) repeat protein
VSILNRLFGKRNTRPDSQAILAALQEFVNARTWSESRRVVEAHPELLTDEADRLLALLLEQYQDNAEAVRILEEHRVLLRRCREVGIGEAFARKMGPPLAAGSEQAAMMAIAALATLPADLRAALAELAAGASSPEDLEHALAARPELRAVLEQALAGMVSLSPEVGRGAWDEGLTVPPEFAADVNRAVQLEEAARRDPRAHPERIRIWQSVLSRIPPGRHATFRAAVNNELGTAYCDLPVGDRAANLQQAIACYRQALLVYTPEATPFGYAGTQNNLGLAYGDLPVGDRAANLEQAIACYRQALLFYTPEAAPLQYAATQKNLGNAYRNLPTGDRAANLEQAIACYRQALLFYTPEAAPLDYAMTQNNLGDAYQSLPVGDQAANLEQAIACYREALRFRTPEAAPFQYATTQNNLGNAYRSLPTGDRAANLEQAIACYRQALRFHTPEAAPIKFAATQNNLGNAYSDLPTGDRAANLKQAIACYHQALRFWTPEAAPLEYAMTQNNLGNAYRSLPTGDRAANLEQAIACYRQALLFWTPEAAPLEFAATQNNLGNVYRDLQVGDRAANLEQAIECYHQALRFRTPEAAPFEYAGTRNNLGAAYSDLPTGDRAANLREAIACYREALRFWTPEAAPLEYAMTQDNLGNAYRDLPAGDRAANLEQAIACYRQALRFRTPEAAPFEYATTHNNLGTAYGDLPVGDRAANLEQAIACYRQALRFCTPEAAPFQYAATQNNLGNAYRNLPIGDRAANLEQAIACYRQALLFYTPEAAPLDYAMTQNNLGAAYADLPTGDRTANLEQAIECYRQALRFRTPEAAPLDYAMTQNNLGNAYRSLPVGDRAANLEQAIACYRQALLFYTLEAAPFQYATTQDNLGDAYRNLPTGDRAANLEQAIACYREALRVYTPEVHPHNCRGMARNLANLYFQERDWTQARAACAIAIRAAEVLHRASYSPGGKEAELGENAALYTRMVQVCLEQSDHAAALVHVEGGKARAFLDQMGQGAFPPPPGLPPDLRQREAQLVERLREQEQALAVLAGRRMEVGGERSPSREREVIEQRRETLATLEAVWDEMTHECPAARAYVAARRGEPVTWEDLRGLAGGLGPEAALVEFYALPEEVAVFVLRAGWEAPRVHRVPLDQQVLFYRYLLPYLDEVLNRRWFVGSGRTPTHAWLSLGERLLASLEPLLGDAARVHFVPHGLLHYLPLHALTVAGQPFIVRRAVAYAPSAAVLARTLEAASTGGSSALVMGYTPNADPVERALFEGEAQSIAAHLHTPSLLGRKADAEALQQRGPGARIIHLSCHGHFRADDPAASEVHLASGDFTTRDWMALPLRADLVTLSACETGLSEIGAGDDLTGLTRAILYAGASSALVTLWSVRVDTTLEWMLNFYGRAWDEWGNRKATKALAFQQATLALREQHPDPYHWAPFTLVGDWR